MNAPKRVVFFSPHAGIWSHALAESYLAKYLDDRLFEISRISCDGTFAAHCTVMEAIGIDLNRSTQEKAKICKQCVKSAEILRPSYRGNDYRLSDYLSADEIAQARRLGGELQQENIESFSFLGVEVAKIAAYETLLKFKKTSASLLDHEFAHLKTYVTNSLMSLMAFSHLYEEIKPDILITYSPQYGVNGVCARYCEQRGTKVYFIEGSANINERYRATRVWDWTAFGMTNPALKYWPQIDQFDISSDDVDRVRRHKDRLRTATSFSVYSEPESGQFDLRAHFSVPAGAKVVLAAMSSYDEVFSAYFIGRFPSNKYFSPVFSNQFEWIRSSIPFFAQHPELFFIIRVHPRTFPNKREAVVAAGQEELAKLFSELPANVRVNYPTDKISIYDLFKQIDVLVTGWSATGVEAMTYGVPVVTYDRNLPSYPASIHYTGDSQEQYFANLLEAARVGRNRSVADAVEKWLTFSMSLGVIRHPARFREEEIVVDNRLLRLGLTLAETFLPALTKRVETLRPLRLADERQRFNQLLSSGADSVFAVRRTAR
jgi:hypothetical protein